MYLQVPFFINFNHYLRTLTLTATGFPRAICLDDFKSGSAPHDGMNMVLINAENHRVIDVIKSRKNQYLKSCFLRFDRKARLAVRLVGVDLYDPYCNLINELFPNAIIIADHFHIVIQAYTALKTTRIHVMNRYGKETHEYCALKRYAKLIMTSNEKLNFTQYYSRINFKHAWLSSPSPEVVERFFKCLMTFELRMNITKTFYIFFTP